MNSEGFEKGIMKEMDEILELCVYQMEIAAAGYEMMGRMLDQTSLQLTIKQAGISQIYIYGGGYLGIQLYKAVNQFVNVLSIVDQKGKLLIDIPDIPVISLDKLKNVYNGQKVVITPHKFSREIYQELSKFIEKDQLVYLGELLGGKL